MRKFLRALLVLLLLCPCPAALAESMSNPELDAPVAFLREAVPHLAAGEPFRVRAAYRIELPEDTVGIHETILENYAPYQRMYLVEVSPAFAEIGPILSSLFYCAGLLADGTYELCSTPQQIAARIFDYKALETLVITPLDP